MSEPLDLERIKAYCEKATAGKWDRMQGGSVFAPPMRVSAGSRVLFYREHCDQQDADNFDFCANARTDLPAAVEEIERLRAEVERLKEDCNTLRIRYTQIQAQDL